MPLQPLPNNQLQVLEARPLWPKTASYQAQKASIHSGNKNQDRDDEVKASELFGIAVEAGTLSSILSWPGTENQHSNESIALYHERGKAQALKMKQKREILEKLLEEKGQIRNQDSYARVQEMGVFIRSAYLIMDALREKRERFETTAVRPTRANPKCGRWDINRAHLTMVIDEILHINSERRNLGGARTLMKKIHKGQTLPPPDNKRKEVLYMWYMVFHCLAFCQRANLNERDIGSKLCMLIEHGGPASGLFLARGPPHLKVYSIKHRLQRLKFGEKDFEEKGYMRRFQHNRHIFTAWADARWGNWRQLLEGVGVYIDNALDPPRVQSGDEYRLYRGIFDEMTRTYCVELFSSKESATYILNSGIGEGSSGVEDWEIHLDCPVECRCLRCAVWKPPPVLVVETEIKNPCLGKTIVATQVWLSIYMIQR